MGSLGKCELIDCARHVIYDEDICCVGQATFTSNLASNAFQSFLPSDGIHIAPVRLTIRVCAVMIGSLDVTDEDVILTGKIAYFPIQNDAHVDYVNSESIASAGPSISPGAF